LKRLGITSAIAWAITVGVGLSAATPTLALDGPNGRLTQVNSGPAVTHGCITDDGSAGACTNGRALDSPTAEALAIAPDGTQLYSGSDAGIAILQRDFRTGAALQSFGVDGCFNFLGSDDGFPCGTITGGPDPIGAVNAIAVSPDGANVYAAVPANDAVISFQRDPATGSLTPLGDAIGGGIATTCAALAPGTPADTAGCADARAIDDPGAVAVSPDGAYLYISSGGSDAVAVFARGAEGKLTQLSSGTNGSDACLSDDGTSEDPGPGTCRDGNDVVLAASTRMPLAVSPDSADVFVGGSGGVLDLRRGAAGELTETDCLYEPGPLAGCDAAAPGFLNPTALAVSPDGATLYGASAANNAIGWAARGGPGSLVGPGSCTGEAGSGCTGPTARAIADPESLALSPDGSSLYAASFQSRAVTVFDRSAVGGALTQQTGAAGCVAEAPGTPADTAGCADGKALTASVSVVASSDGNHVYTGARSPTNGVAAFARTSPPDTAFSIAPNHVTRRRRARFVTFSNEPIGAVICHLDKQPPRFCDTDVSTPKLKRGLHRFEAYAEDLSGQADPTPVVWFWAVKKKKKRHKKHSGRHGKKHGGLGGKK
jgi:sugar lactone lactonase YvrE